MDRAGDLRGRAESRTKAAGAPSGLSLQLAGIWPGTTGRSPLGGCDRGA